MTDPARTAPATTERSATRAGTLEDVHEDPRVRRDRAADDEQGRFTAAIKRFGHRFRAFQSRARRTRTGALALRIGVTLVGGLVLLAGIVMLAGPGQGVLAVIFGLAILATEYAWAERWMTSLKDRLQAARDMDPAERREQAANLTVATVVLVAIALWMISFYGWPGFALSGWDTLQGWLPFLGELPLSDVGR